jgi:geranylgeranyl pyrophosphate synthase
MVDESERYGLNMGIAFQMVDDVLDVVGHAALLGKPTGMDLRDGNPSLPIILALDDAVVREAFEQPESNEGRTCEALEAIKRGPAIPQAKEMSRHYAETALASLKKLPASPYRNGLKTLVQLIIDRDF